GLQSGKVPYVSGGTGLESALLWQSASPLSAGMGFKLRQATITEKVMPNNQSTSSQSTISLWSNKQEIAESAEVEAVLAKANTEVLVDPLTEGFVGARPNDPSPSSSEKGVKGTRARERTTSPPPLPWSQGTSTALIPTAAGSKYSSCPNSKALANSKLGLGLGSRQRCLFS
ncbi:unnamed protein product, partial [Discosporangium mesarthrocarpum]